MRVIILRCLALRRRKFERNQPLGAGPKRLPNAQDKFGHWYPIMGRKAGTRARVSALKCFLAAPLLFGAVCGCVAHGKVGAALSDGKTFDVRNFGAVGDAKTLSTSAIQKVLDQCGEAGG